jgi:hypothetical protein
MDAHQVLSLSVAWGVAGAKLVWNERPSPVDQLSGGWRGSLRLGDVTMTAQDRPDDQPSHDVGTGDTVSVSRSAASNPVLRQLDAINEDLASYPVPDLRDIAAKAADLAAKADEAAGPMAQRTADEPASVGERMATKSHDVASDLRRDTAVATSGSAPLQPVEQTTAEIEAGLPPR